MTKMERGRRERGWTQTELAFRAGLHQSQVSSFERRARNPTDEQREAIAGLLKVASEELMDEASDGCPREEEKEDS